MDYGGNRYSGFSTEKDLPILQQRLVSGETARSILHNQSNYGDSECTNALQERESMNKLTVNCMNGNRSSQEQRAPSDLGTRM